MEYKKESFEMFGQTKERIENDAVRFLFLLEPMTDEDRQRVLDQSLEAMTRLENKG